MDEDIIVGMVILFLFLFVFTLPLSITACVAAANTRKWSQEKARRSQSGFQGTEEANPLVDSSDSEPDDEFLDSEDEAYTRDKRDQKRREREETEADWRLTTRCKFFKEWKKCWKGGEGTKEQLAKDRELKEQDERRKIAREAVREYLRVERKKARKAQRIVGEQRLGVKKE